MSHHDLTTVLLTAVFPAKNVMLLRLILIAPGLEFIRSAQLCSYATQYLVRAVDLSSGFIGESRLSSSNDRFTCK